MGLATVYESQRYNLPGALTETRPRPGQVKAPQAISDLFNYGLGSKNILAKEQDPIGYPAVAVSELWQSFDVNNPFQVGARQFDTSSYMKSQIVRPARTVFVNPTATTASVTPYTPIRGS
jgi:hypothetical protein